jgi:hypothetical protein
MKNKAKAITKTVLNDLGFEVKPYLTFKKVVTKDKLLSIELHPHDESFKEHTVFLAQDLEDGTYNTVVLKNIKTLDELNKLLEVITD